MSRSSGPSLFHCMWQDPSCGLQPVQNREPSFTVHDTAPSPQKHEISTDGAWAQSDLSHRHALPDFRQMLEAALQQEAAGQPASQVYSQLRLVTSTMATGIYMGHSIVCTFDLTHLDHSFGHHYDYELNECMTHRLAKGLISCEQMKQAM